MIRGSLLLFIACTALLSQVHGQCANGVFTTGEGCDDGNLVNGDGCSSACQQEAGFSCTRILGTRSTCTRVVATTAAVTAGAVTATAVTAGLTTDDDGDTDSDSSEEFSWWIIPIILAAVFALCICALLAWVFKQRPEPVDVVYTNNPIGGPKTAPYSYDGYPQSYDYGYAAEPEGEGYGAAPVAEEGYVEQPMPMDAQFSDSPMAPSTTVPAY